LNAPGKRLSRIYRIRQIQEEHARLAVESVVAGLRRAEAGAVEARVQAQEARGQRNRALQEAGFFAGSGATQCRPEHWLEAEAEAALCHTMELRYAQKIPELLEDLGMKRESYLERRRERRKLEIVLLKAAERDRYERERRTRAELDDLFEIRRRWRRESENVPT
jgi:hypothetical protein